MRQWAMIVVVLLLAACSDDDRPSASTTSTTPDADRIPVVDVGDGLAAECTHAAELLGMAVPCPMRLPEFAGAAPSCADPSPPCVSQAGGDETLDTIFFLNVEGSEATSPVAHLIVEARRVEKAPPLPCYDGTERPPISAGTRTLRVLRCPEKDEGADAVVRHGEGAHYGHLLGYWDEAGIRYVVSVHDRSNRGRDLLTAVAAEIVLTVP